MAWGGPTLKGPQGLDLESIFDKHTRNKSISFSVATVVCIRKAPMMSNTSNLGSATRIDCTSADTAKSAAGKVNCTNLLDSELFVLMVARLFSQVSLGACLELDVSRRNWLTHINPCCLNWPMPLLKNIRHVTFSLSIAINSITWQFKMLKYSI